MKTPDEIFALRSNYAEEAVIALDGFCGGELETLAQRFTTNRTFVISIWTDEKQENKLYDYLTDPAIEEAFKESCAMSEWILEIVKTEGRFRLTFTPTKDLTF